jgi:hypothetical protein
MAPVATIPAESTFGSFEVKKPVQEIVRLANPFYSPAGEEDNDDTYQYSQYKVILLISLLVPAFH